MIVGSNILAGASGQQGYFLNRSVRLRASASAYFNRTFTTPTNNTVWSWSGWVKIGQLGTTRIFLGGSGTNYGSFGFETTDQIRFWNNAGAALATSTAVFRDPSAWYHVVVISNGTTIKAYVNNAEVLSYTGTITNINSAIAHNIGRFGSIAYYFDGYLTEINFVDGQALTTTSFGEYNTITGVWQPKKYGGTYGTNGFYLNFNDNSAATAAAIGKDSSGNGNNWTPNNISVTAGVTYDSMTDVPTLTSPTTSNFCVGNPLNSDGSTWTNANLNFSLPNSTNNAQGTMAATSGKFYWEVVYTSGAQGTGVQEIGLRTRWTNGIIYSPDGSKYINGTNSAYGATYTTGDVIGVALDMTVGTVTFYKNNVSQGAISISGSGMVNATFALTAGGGVTSVGYVNFGQRPFTYTPPTGFNRLNTYNLPTPTIANGATQFAATTYTGNGGTQSITNTVNGKSFQPDLVWVKARSVAYNNYLEDSVRGVGKDLSSNATDAEATYNLLTSFNSNGFTAFTNGTYLASNQNGTTYVGWQWKASNATAVTNTSGSISSQVSANPTAGFSIVTYTGTGANATVGHGLGVAPKMIIVKNRTSATDWCVWNTSVSTTYGNSYCLFLQLTNSAGSYPAVFNSTAPTSSVFSIGTSTAVNSNTNNYVAYAFSEIAGYSKFGSYTGNASTDGAFIYTGFRPRFILIKNITTAGYNWMIMDTSRLGYNVNNYTLSPNLTGVEQGYTPLDILSNGFKIRTTDGNWNVSGNTYIYAAFAESSFNYSLAR